MNGQQKVEASFFKVFNDFFEKNIERQGVKGDWLFELNEITGIHKFDYNHDNLTDILVEFNAAAVEGKSQKLYFIVLFRSEANSYNMENFIPIKQLQFQKFIDDEFIFRQLGENSAKIVYKLVNSKLELI
jgi:hypothetical protein